MPTAERPLKLDKNESVERVNHSTPSRRAARRDRFRRVAPGAKAEVS